MAIYRRDIRQLAKAPASTNKAPAKKMELPVLLMMCGDEELRQFIIHYAKEQPGIHDALQDYLLPGQQSAGYPSAISGQLFGFSTVRYKRTKDTNIVC